jgi:hypothetical protein
LPTYAHLVFATVNFNDADFNDIDGKDFFINFNDEHWH